VAKKPYTKDYLLTKISWKIKALRKNAGYTSYETFAIDHDIDRKQYWRAENGSNLTIHSLMQILNKHKISMEDFFKDI